MKAKLDAASAKNWDEAYDGQDTPWDLSGPTPEFVRLLKEGFFGSAAEIQARPITVLVPGCGRGYDAIELAKAGLKVVALDFSSAALKQARRLARAEKVLDKIEWLTEDFFLWAAKPLNQKRFDFVLEYTFYCAIPVNRRADYAKAMAAIIKPGGALLGLYFPLEPRPDGPPFTVTTAEVDSLLLEAFAMEWQVPKQSVKPRKDREKLLIARRKV